MPQPSPEPRVPETPFPQLRESLLRAGIAPRHVCRYLAELSDHLVDLAAEEQQRGLSSAEAHTAALTRLGTVDTLAHAMIAQSRFQSLSARVPWAVFSLTPILLLAAVWFFAICLLRLGWHLFLPGAITPFSAGPGPHHLFDPHNVYFQLNRALYFGGPILVGWCMVATAARQRLKSLWPLFSLALLGLLAATAHVEANRLVIPSGFGHIRLTFALTSAAQIEYAMVVLLLSLPPYLLWKLPSHRALSV